jgi:hypothetical protein
VAIPTIRTHVPILIFRSLNSDTSFAPKGT